MALNNAQFDTIIRGYQLRQAKMRHELTDRMEEAFSRLPRLAEIDSEVASKSVACGRKLLSGDDTALARLRQEIFQLSAERTSVLNQGGYPADYLQLRYICPDCQDTGFVNNEKCHCFKKAEIDLLYTQSNLMHILEEENFSQMSAQYYSSDLFDPSGKLSARANFERAVSVCRRFVAQFDTAHDNLFFYGETGLGKTFLSHCIAKELLDTTHSVIYFSAQELFEKLAQERFHRTDDSLGTSSMIYECDLLIIDDLGTEAANTFVISELFSCLNHRMLNQKSTIISTNLSIGAFSSTYSQRIFSRISNEYTMIKLFGTDIRVQKKRQKRALKV